MTALLRSSRWMLPLLLAAAGVVAAARSGGGAHLAFAGLGGAALGSLLHLLLCGVALLCGDLEVEDAAAAGGDPRIIEEIERELRRRTAARVLLPLLLLLAQRAEAQRGMDAAHAKMFGQPLYMEDMAPGTLTVKVVDDAMDRPRVGQTVELHAQQEGAALARIATAKTDREGRAHFPQLTPQRRYQAIVPLDAGTVASAVFPAPTSGGVRLLLSIAAAGAGPTSAPAIVAGGTQSGAARLDAAAGLADGTVQVQVLRGEPPKPVRGIAVRFEPRAGAPQDERSDGQGLASFRRGGVRSVIATVTYAGVRYATATIAPPAEGGVRATFSVFDTTTSIRGLWFVAGTHLIARHGEQRVGLRQVITLENRAAELYDPGPDGLPLPLPAGAVAVEIPREQAQLLAHDERRGRVALLNPVPPGKLTLEYAYELPYEGAGLDLRARVPVAAERWTFVILAGAELRARGPSVAHQRVERMGGAGARVITLHGAGGPAWLDVSITGLPTADRRMSYGALGLVGLAAIWALLAGLGARRTRAARRAALLEALVAVELAGRRGTRDAAAQAAQAARRGRLLAELVPLWQSTGGEAPPGAGDERER